jgi:transposase
VSGAATPATPAEKTSLQAFERETERVQQARAAYWERLAPLDLRRGKCLDESAVKLAMTRMYGRASLGERVMGRVPRHDGEHLTRLGALGVDGLQAVMTVNGATDADVFRAYVKQGLGPTLGPGDLVVMDHLSAHKARGRQQALARRRVPRLYLPPHSPDLSPMERWLSKLKTALRTGKASTRVALDTGVQQAMHTVTTLDARNWFKHCGYAIH